LRVLLSQHRSGLWLQHEYDESNCAIRSVMTTEDDRFQCWLMEMTDALARLAKSLPAGVSEGMNFSRESIAVVEAYCLEKYANVQEAKKPSEAQSLDGLARYVGQVFRGRLGGRWTINNSDPKNAFYGLPQLTGMTGQRTQICPLTLVTASLDRRTGKFITMVFDSCLKDADLAANSGSR
jgi:hypothetical protein